MKYFLKILVLKICIILLATCAKPTVVNIVLPEDKKLNCEQLENEIAESQKIKKEAEYAREATGGNMARVILFWPAWAQTLHNADVAIRAADDRIYHLFMIMKKKKCNSTNKIEAQITNTENQSSITEQLKELKEMYKSGDLTKDEYKKAKNKVLN
tara:strand:+ start:266 stop:733 length:468 start_codon:yes stop_codon:yes gene_type:complete